MKHLQEVGKAEVCTLVIRNYAIFPMYFAEWVSENFHVWQAFVAEADKVISRGFDHYSARTILHVLRHHSAVSDAGESDWKLNNNVSPYLARLFAEVYPEYSDFFEYRKTVNERWAFA